MNSQRIQEMVRYYDLRASIYDASMQYDQPDALIKHTRVLEALKGWFRDRSILEIACGPGFWTAQIAPVAKRILATDTNAAMITEAQKKFFPLGKVQFEEADAYSLESITESFDAAFAGDWWSHIPKERISNFLAALTSKLNPGARLAFTDQLPNEKSYREGSHHDEAGNHIQRRHLPDSSQFEVIKNFPTEDELHSAIKPWAVDAHYHTFPECRRWLLTFTLKV